MNIKLAILLLVAFLAGCNNNQQNSVPKEITSENKITNDTIVGSKTITDEIAGSAYRKRAIGYFVVTDSDTSKFTCIFVESKDGGKVHIDLNIPYSKNTMTYNQRIRELRLILPIAFKDFNLDSLSSIYLGRLVQNGDISIVVTRQYEKQFGNTNRIKLTDYPKIAAFLKESQLAIDLNDLFKPYSFVVDEIFPEKLFFTSKKELYRLSPIETDTTNVPNRIIDCMTVVQLKKNNYP